MWIIIPRLVPAWLSSIIDSIVSFPGKALYELHQKIACILCDVPTYKRMYVLSQDENQENMPFGTIYSPYQALFITLFPLLLNSFVCLLLIIPGIVSYQMHGLILGHPLECFFVLYSSWIGITAGFYAITSKEDIDKLLDFTNIEESNIWLNLGIYLIMLFSFPAIGALCRIGYVLSLAMLINTLII